MSCTARSCGRSQAQSSADGVRAMVNAHCAVEDVARESYGRLIAYLSVRFRDMAEVEDALSDAFMAALESWPNNGVPEKPEAWLLTVARRRLIDGTRRAQLLSRSMPTLIAITEEAQEQARINASFPDVRLKLLFLCAHPAIDTSIHAPLMLQTVLGLDAARIASAFLIQPSTMGQRLSRAKRKIRDAGITLGLLSENELPARLRPVLEAIYAAYGSGWDDITGSDPRRKELTREGLYLGRLLSQLLPAEPEVHGLLALMLHCEARRDARRTPDGRYVPLSAQDVTLWSRPLIEEAEHHLNEAARAGRIGRFQLEAAIQSVHAQRMWTGRTEWEAVAILYEGLVQMAPTIGLLVGRAAAVSEARGAEQGMALLESIPSESVKSYQPYWALVAHLSKRLQPAMFAYNLAIGLSQDQATRAFLAHEASQFRQHNVDS